MDDLFWRVMPDAFWQWWCRHRCRLLGHKRVIYGVMRDICIDCLTVVDEHPDGRRGAE